MYIIITRRMALCATSRLFVIQSPLVSDPSNKFEFKNDPVQWHTIILAHLPNNFFFEFIQVLLKFTLLPSLRDWLTAS